MTDESRYQPKGVLSEGEHSLLERAFDRELQRNVVLKRLRGTRALDGKDGKRILREARALAQVRSPFVVGVLGTGEDEEGPYLVLEEPLGIPLAEALAAGRGLDPGRAQALGLDLCEALTAAHRAGIVHGNLDSSRVLVDATGRARLTGFSLARASAEAPGFDTTIGQVTEIGAEGPPYAPEVALGGAPVAASDLFALASLLVTALCGDPPYPTEATGTKVDLQLLRRRMPDLPPALLGCLEKSLQPLPEDRYGSAAEFGAALRVAGSEAPEGSPADTRRPSSIPRALAGLAALTLVLVLWRPWAAPTLADGPVDRGVGLAAADDTQAFGTLSPGYSGSHALVVGIDEYEDFGWPRLGCAESDAQAFRDHLVNQAGFAESDVILLLGKQATRGAIYGHLDGFSNPERVGSDDRVLFYFAGHGEQRGVVVGGAGSRGYLVPYDAPRTGPFLSHAVLTEAQETCPAKHFLTLLDCCYGGWVAQRSAPPARRRFDALTTQPARQVMTAGGPGEPVSDAVDAGSPHSPFTHYLLEGLQGGAAPGSAFVTGSELGLYVSRRMLESGRAQNPVWATIHGTGDFVFERAPDTDER